jgi:hypothetical protein
MEVFSFILLIYYLWSTTVQDFAWSAPTEAGLTDHAWSLDELVRSLRQRKAEAGSMSNTVYMLWFEQERDDCDDCELFEANGLSLEWMPSPAAPFAILNCLYVSAWNP